VALEDPTLPDLLFWEAFCFVGIAHSSRFWWNTWKLHSLRRWTRSLGISLTFNRLQCSDHLPFPAFFGSQHVILINGSREGSPSSRSPCLDIKADLCKPLGSWAGGRGEWESPSPRNGLWHMKREIVTPFTASPWETNLFWHTEK
jgi:hypothetical protein